MIGSPRRDWRVDLPGGGISPYNGSMQESARLASPSSPPRPTFTEGLATPLQFVKGVGPRIALTLQKMGLVTVEDLLFHFPHRYEDRRNFRPLGHVRHGETVCTAGSVVGVTIDRT